MITQRLGVKAEKISLPHIVTCVKISARLNKLSTRDTGLSPQAMATHSSTLAWKIPWTEEPGGLQSMGSRRVRHD